MSTSPLPRPTGATASRLLPTPPTDAAASGTVVTEERPHPLTPIVQVWVWLVGIVVVFGRQLLETPQAGLSFDIGRFPVWVVPLGVVGVFSIGRNLWAWWTTRFVATESELRVEHKGVEHESKRIAYQRIQSVDVTQRFAARMLGMAELTIDVGADRPVRLQYLARARAVELRDFLMARAHGRRPAPGASGVASAWDDSGAADRVLVRVPAGELVLGAALSHELLLLVLAAGVPLAIGIAIGEPLLIGGGVLPILLSIGGFVSRRVVGQFRYTLAETPSGLRITRGLTSLSSETVPVHRVQAIRLHAPVLWRLVGRARVDLSFLGLRGITTNEDGVGASSIMLPIGGPDAVRTAVEAIWPGLILDDIALSPAPRRARWLAPLAWRWIGYGWDERVLVMRRGWWTRTTWVVPHARVQSVRTDVGNARRLLGVATVEVHTTDVAGVPTTFMSDAEASRFVFDELARARSARVRDPR